jgi:hypothetical protein
MLWILYMLRSPIKIWRHGGISAAKWAATGYHPWRDLWIGAPKILDQQCEYYEKGEQA